MEHLKEQCREIFCFRFFLDSSSPKPLKITLGSFRIFSKIRGDIRKSRYKRHRWQICQRCQLYRKKLFPPVSTGVNDTGGAPWIGNISTTFRKKIRNGPNGIPRGLGETTVIHEKYWTRKSRGTVPLTPGTSGLCKNVFCWCILYRLTIQYVGRYRFKSDVKIQSV